MSEQTDRESDTTETVISPSGPVDKREANRAFVHECESCGLKVMLTPMVAYNLGWDYPPMMGQWGVVGPRTCGHCGIETTLWWALVAEHKTVDQLTEQQMRTAIRIAQTERAEHPPT
jgi:hypothetical protein